VPLRPDIWATLSALTIAAGIGSPALAQDRAVPTFSVEPFIGAGSFWGAGPFSTNINIRPSPVYGGRISRALSPRLSIMGEYQRAAPEERSPEGCTNEICAQLMGPTTLSLWSIGGDWRLTSPTQPRSPELYLSVGLGHVRLRTQREAAPDATYRQTGLVLGGTTEYRLSARVSARVSLTNYMSPVSLDYGVGISSHASARTGIRVNFR
jgi:hypothetical protein